MANPPASQASSASRSPWGSVLASHHSPFHRSSRVMPMPRWAPQSPPTLPRTSCSLQPGALTPQADRMLPTDGPAAGRLLGADRREARPLGARGIRASGQGGECGARWRCPTSDWHLQPRSPSGALLVITRQLASPRLRAELFCSAGQAPSSESPLLFSRTPSFLKNSNRVPRQVPSAWGGRLPLDRWRPSPTAPSRKASAPGVLWGCQATISELVFREQWCPRPPQQRLALCSRS